MPPYTLKNNSKSKRLTIRIKNDGVVTVTKPSFITLAQVENFLLEKASWINKHLFRIQSEPQKKSTLSKKDYLLHKSAATELALRKVTIFNQHYNFTFKKITIKNQKTRWGSCSKRGNISFNYKIALIPENLVDYIVVHELCHLGEFNHSMKFWDLVEQMIPDYLERKKELRKIVL